MQASVAIDGSKFKAVNNRDKNFTPAKLERCLAQMQSGERAITRSPHHFTFDRLL
jgi:hypothetical protein